jgi:23S rRNA pseudouridine2605 synthase
LTDFPWSLSRRKEGILNQQQLQIARAALWRQTAGTDPGPVATFDDAAAWLDEIGLCLFLPRPAQLPAPAPSFAEACLGAPSAAPPPDALAQANALATRLLFAGRAIPLNLLGTFSEQPDFLVTPELLPWVAAIRGDRQWKSAPAGRTAPIVVRTWAALDQHGPLTAVEIRELLGRELTEAAVLRALVELWTTLRAAPAYAEGEPTRWSLLKNRYARQLTTAANTALPTALSALLSVYLRSAVAATAEEAEIFLSPLTARSRIREVLHMMTAARQFGTLSLGSHTLLFVEGSLPETPPPAETAEPAAPAVPEISAPQAESRREPRAKRPPFGEKSAPRRDFAAKRPPFRRESGPRPYQKRQDGQARDREFPPRRNDRPGFQRREEVSEGPRRESRPASKLPRRDDRPRFQSGDDRGPSKFPRRESRPWQKDRPKSWAKPNNRRRDDARPPSDSRDDKGQSSFASPRRKPFVGKPKFAGKPRFSGAPDRGPRPGRPNARPDFRRSESRGPREDRPGDSGARPDARRPFSKGKFGSRPPQKFRGDRPAPRFGKGPGSDKPRFGKGPGKPAYRTGQGKPGFSPSGKSGKFGASRSSRKNFPQSSAPRGRNPRKNRNQEESSE